MTKKEEDLIGDKRIFTVQMPLNLILPWRPSCLPFITGSKRHVTSLRLFVWKGLCHVLLVSWSGHLVGFIKGPRVPNKLLPTNLQSAENSVQDHGRREDKKLVE